MRTYRRMLKVGLALATLGLVAGACAGDQTGTETDDPAAGSVATGETAAPTTEGPTDTLKLGAAVALTGAVSREGNLVKDGFEYWQKKVNETGGIEVEGTKHKVEIVFYDDESDAETGTRLTEKLITEDGAQFILGPYSSGITTATTTITERRGVITVAPQANADAIYERGYEYVFSVLPPASTYLRGVIDMAKTLDPQPRTVAIMIRDDPFGIAAGEGAAKYATEQGFEVVFQEKYPANATDVSSILTRVKGRNPDILLASTLFQDSLLITKGLKNLRFSPDIVGFTAGPALPDFRSSLGTDAQYVMGSEWWLPSLQYEGEEVLGSTAEYAAGIEEEYGYVPGYHTASGSMAGLVLQLAIERAGSLDTEAVRSAFLEVEPQTFWGPIGWSEEGKNVLGTSNPVQILSDEVVPVWPEEAREQQPVYPFVPWDER